MVGNLFWEHGHRMVATTVGMLTIVLAVYIRVKEKREWVWKLGCFALLGCDRSGIARRVDREVYAAACRFNRSRNACAAFLLHYSQPGCFHFAKLD